MADAQKHYKVLEMRAKDVRRIRAIEIEPNASGVSIIAGRNGQGKTSAVDSFRMAIAGGSKEYAKAIRDGQDKLETWINCGDFEVKRTVARDGSQELHVRAADGVPVKRPQEFLKSICGDLQFDPLGFSRLPARDRRERLLVLSGLDREVADLDRQRLVAEEKRKDAGRVKREREAVLEALGQCDTLPTTPMDTSELVAKTNENLLRNETIAKLEGVLAADERARSEAQSRLQELERECYQIVERIEGITKHAVSIRNELSSVEERGVHDIGAAMREAEDHNAKYERRGRWERAKLDCERALDDYRHHDVTIKTIDKLKAEALESAKMPIPGLGFDGQDVTFGDRPFSELSASETLKVSLAIAMAANPSFRMIFIEDGSLLDDDNLKLIDDLGRQEDFQIVVECVGDREDALIVIEDGARKEAE